MNRTRIVFVFTAVVVIVLAVFTACKPPQEYTASDPISISNKVDRFIDEEAGVVCWVYYQSSIEKAGGGLSCMPISETNLKEIF